MKQFLLPFLIFMSYFLLSCNNEAGTTTGDKTDSATAGTNNNEQAMLEATRQIYKGIETGDSTLLQRYISEDAVDHGGGPNGEDVKGKQIISMLSTFHQDIDNLKMNVEEIAANDDHVFSLVHMTGTTNKAVWGMPANTKMNNRSVDLLRIRNGKIVEHWGFADPVEIMKMMQKAPSAQKSNRTDTGRTTGSR